MKVYTKTGDKGMTSLVGGERVYKSDERVEAYGTVDELSAFTALLTDRLREDDACMPYIDELNRILSRMMTVDAWLEERIDAMQAALPPIDKFTLPGGHAAVSLCHVCRTVCRRAERAALRADLKYEVAPEVLMWLNRLSDYFYLLGRTLTQYYGVEETLWIP